jgi:hypothetical protein
MANDPNRSGRGTPNTLDNDFIDIESIGRKSSRHTAEDIAQRVRLSQARSRVSTYESALASGATGATADIITSGLSAERKMVNSLEPRIELRAETQRQRSIHMTQTAIERSFQESSVNGQSTQFGRSTAGHRFGMTMMGSSYEDLEAKRMGAINQISSLGQRAIGISEGLYNERGQQDPARMAELQQVYAQRNRLVNKVGGIDVAQRQQRALGMDPESQTRSLFDVGERAAKVNFKESVASDLKTGEMSGQSTAQLKQREIALSQQLVDELEKLKNSAGKSAEEIDNMQRAANKTADEFKRTQEAIAQGGGNRGGPTREGIASGLGLAGNMFGAVGNAVQAIAVNQRLGQVGNVAGYAGIENEKYRTYKAAAGGSVADQLALGQYGEAEGFGKELKVGAYAAQTAYMAGSAAQIAAGGVRLGSTANPISDIVNSSGAAEAAIQGFGDITQGATSGAVTAADMARGVTASQSQIAGVNAQTQARRQISAISSEQLQGFRDFSVGIGAAAIGMGAQGAVFTERMVSKGNLSRMTNSRLSPEQMAEAARVGVQNIGSTFNENQIFAARGMERSGLGTTQENMGRMATLAAGGANNPQAGLASVLEAAFTKSLDGAKTLNMMVENTANMVQASAGRAMGIDTTAAAANILAAGVDKNNPNKEYAVQRAATAEGLMKGIGTDTGMNFAAMSATARIGKMTGLSGTEAIIAQGLDDSTLRSMKTMKPNEIRTKLFDRGIDVKEGQELKMVEQLTKARLITNLQGGGAGLATGVDAAAIADKITAGKPLNKAEQLAYNQASTLTGFAGGAEAQRAATAVVSDEPNTMAKGRAILGMQGEGGSEQQKTLDDMRTQGFKQLSQAALEATASFKTAGDALKALGVLAKSVENIGDKGGEGKFKTAAADSAGTFGKSTMQFERSVSDFQAAVNAMMTKSGVSGTNDTARLLDKLPESGTKRSGNTSGVGK